MNTMINIALYSSVKRREEPPDWCFQHIAASAHYGIHAVLDVLLPDLCQFYRQRCLDNWAWIGPRLLLRLGNFHNKIVRRVFDKRVWKDMEHGGCFLFTTGPLGEEADYLICVFAKEGLVIVYERGKSKPKREINLKNRWITKKNNDARG